MDLMQVAADYVQYDESENLASLHARRAIAGPLYIGNYPQTQVSILTPQNLCILFPSCVRLPVSPC